MVAHIGKQEFSKIAVYEDFDGGVEISVKGYNTSASTALNNKETKKLIKALKNAIKGGK